MYHILICDDERDIVSALRIYLTAEGYQVFEAYNGKEALDILETNEIHLILMDVMMPVTDGITALTTLRTRYNIPVILLTAKSEDTDKILGLNIGADDYVTKPFNAVELMARVRSQLRRYCALGGMKMEPDILRCGGIELDDNAKRVVCEGNEITLTPTEYAILKLMMEHPGRVYASRELYRSIWHCDSDVTAGGENTVPVHIRHLREKLEIDPANPRYIKVVWGKGYKLESHI